MKEGLFKCIRFGLEDEQRMTKEGQKHDEVFAGGVFPRS